MNEQSIYVRQAIVPPVVTSTSEGHRTLIEYLIRAGSQAPSWYNCQPWRFDVNDKLDKIDVILDCSRDQSFYDWGHFNSLLACGAVIRNILVAARGRGISVYVEYNQRISDGAVVASIQLNFKQTFEASESEKGLESAIWTRHTNPLMYDNTPLGADELQTLKNSIYNVTNVSLHFLTSANYKEKVFAAASCAEPIRFSRRDLHEQLYRMIRWTDKDVYADKTGYSLSSMGVCGFGRIFFRLTRFWPIMKLMNVLGADRNQAKRACRGLTHCGAVGLLTVKGSASQDLVVAGNAMQELWLTATRLGLELQPNNSILQFLWVFKQGGKVFFSLREQQLLKTAFKGLFDAFSDVDLNAGELGVVLFRIGNGPKVYGYTLRK